MGRFKSHHLDTSLDKRPSTASSILQELSMDYQANHAFIPFGFHDIHVMQRQLMRLEENTVCCLCTRVLLDMGV